MFQKDGFNSTYIVLERQGMNPAFDAIAELMTTRATIARWHNLLILDFWPMTSNSLFRIAQENCRVLHDRFQRIRNMDSTVPLGIPELSWQCLPTMNNCVH